MRRHVKSHKKKEKDVVCESNVNAVNSALFLYFGAHKFYIQQILVRFLIVLGHLNVVTTGTDTLKHMKKRAVSLHVITFE